MKLIELEAVFVGQYAKIPNARSEMVDSWHELPSVQGAQGVLFTCPRCQNHQVLCWFLNPRNAPRVPDDTYPLPGRWTFSGETIETLSLQPSVDLSRNNDRPESPGNCKWHGFVTNGDAA